MKVCFLGLGSMGSGVCRNLLNKGYALQVWNRSPEKAAKVAGWGAEAFATPQEAARGAGVVMSCLSSVAALKAVAGGASGVFSCMGEGMAFYDMGTWDIESVLALDAEAERHGVRYVHMPMGKGPEAAEAGESPLFFGGSKDVYERDKAFLSDIGEVFYLGDVKAACAFKLITNLIGLSNNVILTEGVFLAKRMGLSEEAFLNGAKSTGAWSYQMRNSGHKVFAEAFLPMRGTLDNAWKDMKFGVEIGRSVFVGRRTDGRKDDLHLIQTTAQIRGEMQASRFDVAPNQIVEPQFVDRNLARQQTPDLLLVDIDAGHVDAHFGKAGARHQSDVACSHN